MLSKVLSAGLVGIEAYPVEVEVDICLKSFPKWHTVGLAENEVKESKERVVAAIKNSGYDFSQRKVTINLAPADVRKEGTALDLPIALGLLASSEQLEAGTFENFWCVGELSLTGELRPVRGLLPIAIRARAEKVRGILVPKASAPEASMVHGLNVFPVSNLSEAVEFFSGRLQIAPQETLPFKSEDFTHLLDYNDICGQHQAKRTMEVAACGGHNILFVGPPGSGKTMLASRLPTILPSLSFSESLETSRIYSVLSMLEGGKKFLVQRPFRAPHHSISDAGLIGGGTYPKPGEVSLAHNGVLFLDELPEFKKNVLELLRQPLESKNVTIARAVQSLTYPAAFMLVAAMNPCPCGYHGHPRVACTCSPLQIHRYRAKLSGPLLDRIDLQIQVPPVGFEELSSPKTGGDDSKTIRKRVLATRAVQAERFRNDGILLNAQMGPKLMRRHCVLNVEGKKILKTVMERFHLSGRAYDRILKVARTLADMESSENIETAHLLEAVQYRSLDRSLV